jgi:hypothetical protein
MRAIPYAGLKSVVKLGIDLLGITTAAPPDACGETDLIIKWY